MEAKQGLILIVDDIPRNLQVLASTLGNAGYEVAAATSAAKALKTLENITPDLILLDVMMPEMNGFEMCLKLKAAEATKEIPVIFLTAKTETEDIVKGFQSGGVDYVTKPFNSTELLARVTTHLELKRSKEALNESIQKLQLANNEISAKNLKIEEINHHLTDSINYARHIQQAILPKKHEITAIFKESFVFFKPRDIVSGDFFWISRNNGRVIIAVVDCTGHGVPGAFISILSYQLMYDIIVLREIFEPDRILNEVNREIIDVFDREDADIYGGMDVSLCCLDLQKRTIDYAGAKNPLAYVHNNELVEIKGDRFSIGGGFKKRKSKEFTRQVIDIPDSAMFYLFSDGFLDQLSTQERRFGRKQFRKLLKQIGHLSMEAQEEVLEKTLTQWMGSENEQIDDILVIGFRL
jgi:DNA-binding response OmpR family regulator